MATEPKKITKEIRQRRYLARDFDSLRQSLLDYARQYYPDRIQDFSEASIGGLFLDMAAYVGDNLSFYLDHLYGELNPETAVENGSIERALRSSGVTIAGASPATVNVTTYIEVPTASPGDDGPDLSLLPVVKEGSIFTSDSGIPFTLIEDIRFIVDPDENGTYIINPAIKKKVGRRRADGAIVSYFLSLDGLCVSGREVRQVTTVGSFTPFRRIQLEQPNITEIVNVYDDYGNTYYEVGALSHDVVYRNALNSSSDSDLVKDGLRVIHAPYRFTKLTDLATRKTTLLFGGGSAASLEDDVIPDPTEFALPLPYSKTIKRTSLNPEKLLTTNTLGVISSNTNLTITYRYGGGLSHNVTPNSISSITSLSLAFPRNPPNSDAVKVRNSLEISNAMAASGGEDALTPRELIALIPAVKNSQERIVTKEDLLARVYTMPSNLGRVFRASITPNPNNPLSTQLFIISRDNNQRLIMSPDSLKLNLRKYLNSYRMISDAIDVLDAQVVNLQLKFTVVIDPSLNRTSVLSVVLAKLQKQFEIRKMYIDQPIIISDVINTIYSTQGIVAVDSVELINISNVVDNRIYSDVVHDVKSNTKRQMLFPPTGGIFEIRYPDVDIIAKVVT
jgi:hypothetical protein